MQHGRFEVAFGLALEEIADAPLQMCTIAGNTEREFAAREQSRLFGFDPHRAAPSGTMHDLMRDPAKRNDRAGLESDICRQPPQPRADPRTLPLRKCLRLL